MSLHTEHSSTELVDTTNKPLARPVIDNLAAQFAAALIFILVVFFVRRHFIVADGYLWAEDAAIFIAGAYEDGIRSIFMPYAGYLHILPRLLAYALSKIAPISATPYTFVCACVLLYAMSATYLFRVAMRTFGSVGCGVGLACTPFLVAHSGEVYLSLTNLQWVLAPVLLVLIWETFTTGATRNAWAFKLGTLFILTTTGPFAIIFAPVAAVIIWVNRASLANRYGLSALTICVIAGFLQLVAMHFAPQVVANPNLSHDWTRFMWTSEFLRNFVAEIYIPTSKVGQWGVVTGLVLTVLVTLTAILSRQRAICLSLLLLAALMWAIGVWRTGTPDIIVHWYNYGARYVFVPHIFAAWAMLISYKTIPRNLRWLPVLLLALMAWTSLDQFKGTTWSHWSIQYLGNATYKIMVPPGLEANVHDLR